MAGTTSKTAKPVTWARRYFIAEHWWLDDMGTGYSRATQLLTKTEAEDALSERYEDYYDGSAFGVWDNNEEPAVYVLMNNGTFKLVNVTLPKTRVTITEP